MSEGISRKRKVRGGHRGSATRMLHDVYETIESSADRVSIVTKLKQYIISLEEKLSVIKQQDEEILGLVEDEEIENEIGEADTFSGRVRRAIIDATRVIEEGGLTRSTVIPTSVITSTPETSTTSTEVSTVTSTPPSTIPTATLPLSADTSVTDSITVTVVNTTPDSLSTDRVVDTTVTSAPPTPVFTITTGSSTLELPIIPPPIFSTPSLHLAGTRTTRAAVGVPSISDSLSYHSPAASINPSPKVKLPKLTLKKFNGDLTKWTPFWDSYESSIHHNPSLSAIDKFVYLNSLLEGSASEAVAGLRLTAANYNEAVAILQRRFGDTDQIVSKHMEALLTLEAVVSQNNSKALRRLHDQVESQVRGLRALGIPAESYGSLLAPVILSKLPQELRLIVSREVREGRWHLDELMRVIDVEIKARERASNTATSSTNGSRQPKAPDRGLPTNATLFSSDSLVPKCSYCRQQHSSVSCRTVTDPAERKQILRKAGRCFVCLRRHHTSRDCRSPLKCTNCGGRHHVSICKEGATRDGTKTPMTRQDTNSTTATNQQQQVGRNLKNEVDNTPTTTAAFQSSTTEVPVLLQTAQVTVFKPGDPTTSMSTRAIFDSGSQRSYISERVKESLTLDPLYSETMIIKAFGSERGKRQLCDVISLGLRLQAGGSINLSFLAVPLICEPLCGQPISHAAEHYDYLAELNLADHSCGTEQLEVDMLIGSDNYWRLVTGKLVNRGDGPTAVHTRLGWVLSGPVEGLMSQKTSCNLVSTHALKVDAYMQEESDRSLDRTLKTFWDLESLGIQEGEADVYQQFQKQISFKNGRYEVSLPWKEAHPALPTHYDLSLKRLTGLLRRLRQSPDVLQRYDAVIKEQLEKGIVEVVDDARSQGNAIHYLPHHPVIREDKLTTKVRVVYDASAKTSGPSLNECLYAGPKFEQHILDILLRFRLYKTALAADIEKAFLMISVTPGDRDVLRFLWVDDIRKKLPEVLTLRFARVVFGVSSSPFLLNATIRHHVEKYKDSDPAFVETFTRSIYVDDITFGANDDDAAFYLYTKAKKILADGGFNLRKFVSNSQELQRRIELMEGGMRTNECQGEHEPVVDEDKTYTKEVFGGRQASDKEQRILGVKWNFVQDRLVFDLSELASLVRSIEATKRHIVSVASKFYDPLGFISPVTIQFKMLFRDMCVSKVGWDEPLSGGLLRKWNAISSNFDSVTLTIPRCYCWCSQQSSLQYSLFGFCDASSLAYAAVVYIRVETGVGNSVEFVTAKTRVSPVKAQSIPRLELLSALLLARLMNSVLAAFKHEIEFNSLACFTDSKVALCWIRGLEKEWKPFVQNRVNEIRKLVATECWHHCPGKENPADVPSRGSTPSELNSNVQWRHGPSWLVSLTEMPLIEDEPTISETCLLELKVNRPSTSHSLLNASELVNLMEVVDCKKFSKLSRLVRVTAYVYKFVQRMKCKTNRQNVVISSELSSAEIARAELQWLLTIQQGLVKDKAFSMWRKQFGLYLDERGLWRCRGRLENADLPIATRHPVLLPKHHPLTVLVIREAHERVMHNGIKETLAEVRARYWILQGRQVVRQVLSKCVICRRYEGPPQRAPLPPPLPQFRVKDDPAFTYVGVDFAGPLYVKTEGLVSDKKVWICLYTCCVARAVHLDIVPDLTANAFLRCFRRFTSRRGFPRRVVSDNGKTFKSSAKAIQAVLTHPDVKQYSGMVGLQWQFNLEKAPWWGGMFERLVKSTKRCLRKAIGRAKLTYDELLTTLTEVEMILNSRPLSYMASDDVEEPLTPSHLILGRRVINLPTYHEHDDGDFHLSQDVLNRRMQHFHKVLDHFWRRWQREYLLSLRDCHRYSKGGNVKDKLCPGDMVVLYDESKRRGFWKIAKVEKLIRGADEQVRGAVIRIPSRVTGRTSTLRRPVNQLYPLEIACTEVPETNGNPESDNSTESPVTLDDTVTTEDVEPEIRRPRRAAAQRARDWMQAVIRGEL